MIVEGEGEMTEFGAMLGKTDRVPVEMPTAVVLRRRRLVVLTAAVTGDKDGGVRWCGGEREREMAGWETVWRGVWV